MSFSAVEPSSNWISTDLWCTGHASKNMEVAYRELNMLTRLMEVMQERQQNRIEIAAARAKDETVGTLLDVMA